MSYEEGASLLNNPGDGSSARRSSVVDDDDKQTLSTTTSSATLVLCNDTEQPPSSRPAAETMKPMRWRPVIIILMLNSVQPLAFELIFPFVNQMILENGIVKDPERVGFYSGLIESVFACTNFIAILPFTYMSDHYGRKPVILGGLTGLALSMSLFGLSKTLPQMIITRCFAGALGSVWSAMKVMLAEMTDRSNQGTVFSALAITYRMGQILGQPLGGLLAHPERNFALFQSEFWYEYPFSLPCFVAAAFAVIFVTLGYLYVEETAPAVRQRKANRAKYGSASFASDDVSSGSSDELVADTPLKQSRPSIRSVLTPHVLSLCLSTFFLVLASESLFALYPLFAFTPIASGGLGLNEASIGIHMAVRSATNIAVMFLYAPFERRVGTLRLYQLAMAFWPLSMAFFPLLNALARAGGIGRVVFNATLMLFFLAWSVAGFCWSGNGIMINDAAPSQNALATINGVSQMAISLPQAVAPAFVTSTFAYSIRSGIVGGNLIWIVLVAISGLASIHSMTLKQPTRSWRSD